jgi:hypothetical protein
MSDNNTETKPAAPEAMIELHAQVLEILCPQLAVARMADCVFSRREISPVALAAHELPSWLTPGTWVRAYGRAHFCFPGGVCALVVQTLAALPDSDWGGAECVGAEEMVDHHWITTRARVMSEWRWYDVPNGLGERNCGYTADVALPSGQDGTRAVLHWCTSLGGTGCGRETPPRIAVGDLVDVHCDLDWEPYTLSRQLPPRTPILDLFDARQLEVLRDESRTERRHKGSS